MNRVNIESWESGEEWRDATSRNGKADLSFHEVPVRNPPRLNSISKSVGSKHLLSPVPHGLMKNSSLQGIHAQSSTETSGLGETVTSCFSSQESIQSNRERSEQDGGTTDPPNHHASFNSPRLSSNHRSGYGNYSSIASPPVLYVQVEDRGWMPIHIHPDANVHPRGPEGLARRRRSLEEAIEMTGRENNKAGLPAAVTSSEANRAQCESANFDDLFNSSGTPSSARIREPTVSHCTSKPNSKQMTSSGYGQGAVDGYPTPAQPVTGLQPEYIEDNRSRRSSVRSISSLGGGSFRSRSGSTRSSRKFLGKNTESRWLRWSKDRRLSYRRKLDMMEKDSQEEDRVPTPVKKARKECLKFVHPDLEHKYLSEEDLKDHRRQQQVQQQYFYGMLEATNGEGLHLTIMEWHNLVAYWDHKVFTHARYAGVFLSFLALLFTIIAVTNPVWMTYINVPVRGNVTQGLWTECNQENKCQGVEASYHAGIWDKCYQNQTDPKAVVLCPKERTHWQHAVIGFLMFAVSFGFLASILSILGVCTIPLPKKIYYFHSSGEIFLVCAASCTFALLIYPMSIELDNTIRVHRYGIGYGLGWGAAFFFYAAALCMSLDELVRASSRAKCCRCCWDTSNQDEQGNSRQV